MSRIAFIGTGLLGSGMIERMVKQGDTVTVWNRTVEKARALEPLGVRVAERLQDAVADAEVVHMALPDDDVVDTLLVRLVSHLPPGALVIDHTTASPTGTANRLERMAANGVAFLHAPVFMSPQMCRDGQGMVMVSGAEALYERAKDRLARMTGQVWYLGPRPDRAAALKLFGNSMLFVILGGLSDVFAMAKHNDIPNEDVIQLFTKFQIGGALAMRAQKMASGDMTPSFELTMARKDMRLMLEAAGDQPLVVLPPIAARMDEAIAAGHGKDDAAALASVVLSPSR